MAVFGRDDFDHDIARLKALATIFPEAHRLAIAIYAQAAAAAGKLASAAAIAVAKVVANGILCGAAVCRATLAMEPPISALA